MNKHKVDLIISDVSFGQDHSQKEVFNFFKKINSKKIKLIIYTGADWKKPPELINVRMVNKGHAEPTKNLINAIKKTLEKNEIQRLPEKELFKLTRPEYHITTPTEKYLLKQIEESLKGTKQERRKAVLALELNQLKKIISKVKNGEYSQKEMNSIIDKYNKITKELRQKKQETKIKPRKITYKKITKTKMM
jgi:hypothetical protein